MEALNHFPHSFNCFRSEAKKRATESLLCTVVPNLANDISVKTFVHLEKTTSVKIDKYEEYDIL